MKQSSSPQKSDTNLIATFVERIDRLCSAWPRWRFVLVGSLIASGLSLFFFSPQLAVLQKPLPDTFEWARGLAYIDQCDAPLKASYDHSLRWRPLPPFVAHILGLSGLPTLIIPWAGVVALVAFTAFWSDKWLSSRTSAFAMTLLVTTSSAFFVTAGWIGINDAWCWVALLGVVFCRSRWLIAAITILSPWVEERYIIGLPLALWVRGRIRGERNHLIRELLITVPWLTPYFAVRLYYVLVLKDHGSADPLANALREFPTVLVYAPLGWWMGFRAAWFLAGAALLRSIREGQWFWEVATAGMAIMVSAFLAHDLSRSTPILLPWLFLGAVLMDREDRMWTAKAMVVLAGLNLILPAAHIVFYWTDVITPLPMELYHLWTWDVDNLPGFVRPWVR